MKPNFKEILNNSLRVTAELASEALGSNPLYFKEVINLSLKEKPSVNWRAARVIQLNISKNPKLFIPYADKIAKLFPDFKNDGLKRTYAFILSKYVKHIKEENLSGLTEICFSYMLSNQKIAVKYNCMKLLFEISELYPELKGELKSSIEFNISEEIFRMNGDIKKIFERL